MKQIFTYLCCTLITFSAYAQSTGNVSLFTEQGERFWVILNGLRQNEEAATNVKLTDLNAPNYKMKIIFQDPNLGELDKNLYVKLGYEVSFNIKKKDVSQASRHFKQSANNLSQTLNFNKAYDDEDVKEKYVIRFISEVPLAQAPPPAPEQKVIVYHATPPPPQQQVVVQEQTTTTVHHHGTPAGHTHTENVNVGMSVGATGVGFNMNATTSGSAVHTEHVTTTTTVTTTGGAAPAPAPAPEPVYVMPGYNGPVGCPMPMSDQDFYSAKNSISSKSFEDSKIQIAKQITGSNCLTASQVRDVMNLFDFEDTRLDYAKYAYGRTYDLGNYYKVNDAFDFESSIDELNQYINGGY